VVVLVGCSDCRGRRETSGSTRSPRLRAPATVEPSLSRRRGRNPAAARRAKATFEAGARRQSRAYGGGLSKIPCLVSGGRASERRGGSESGSNDPVKAGSARRGANSRRARKRTLDSPGRKAASVRRKLPVRSEPVAEERALVGGRRPGCDDAVVFDETAAKAGPGWLPVRPVERPGSPGGRDKGVRGDAACSTRGRRGRRWEAWREGAFDRGLHLDAQCSNRASARGFGSGGRTRGCSGAEAGGSPSSEAPPEVRRSKVEEGASPRRSLPADRRKPEGRELERERGSRASAIGNRTADGVLVSSVGCRSR